MALTFDFDPFILAVQILGASISLIPSEDILTFCKHTERTTRSGIFIKSRQNTMCKTNSIKVVLSKALTVNYERAREDWLLLIFTPKLGIMWAKHLRDHIGNL